MEQTYPDANPATRNAHNDSGALHRLPPDLDLRQSDECESARRRDLQRRNGFGTEHLADRGASDGETVGEAGVGSPSGALKLEFDGAKTGGGGDFGGRRGGEDADGSTVAELTGEASELVTCGGKGGGARERMWSTREKDVSPAVPTYGGGSKTDLRSTATRAQTLEPRQRP